MAQIPQLIGTGIYPLARASRLVGAELRTVRRWLKGYSWKYHDGRRASGPLWPLEYGDDEALGGEQVLSFRDLLELRTVSRFVQHGVPLRVIRATIDVARNLLGDYPLHSRRFVTDGKEIFLDAVDLAGDGKLISLRERQYAIDAIIRPSLIEGIEYDCDSANALRWFPNPRRRGIVLDPQIQFGEPIVADSGVPTDTLAAAYLAEGKDLGRVARIYRVTTQAVQSAVAFENRLAA